MHKFNFTVIISLFLLSACSTPSPESIRLGELDSYWTEVSRTVGEGDFAGYSATTHPKGVLVAGTHKRCHPLKKALEKWEINFINTKSGAMKAGVEFRFSQRLGDETTAHETGMFKYWEEKDGKLNVEYIHLEALLIKENGHWQTLMEYQKSVGTEAEWNALAK